MPRGGVVAIGAGHPEEVSRVVFEQGRLDDVTFLVESGVVGGLPAPGVYFGAAFSPRAIVSTAQLFKRCERRLDAACLGALEVDAAGNVNVSRRGPGVRRYAGPGGFIDFTSAADALIFVAGWMRGGEIALDGGALRLRQRGRPKFVARVGEVTFNAAQALRDGKRVFYATPVGLFRLTRRGRRAVPGDAGHRRAPRRPRGDADAHRAAPLGAAGGDSGGSRHRRGLRAAPLPRARRRLSRCGAGGGTRHDRGRR